MNKERALYEEARAGLRSLVMNKEPALYEERATFLSIKNINSIAEFMSFYELERKAEVAKRM